MARQSQNPSLSDRDHRGLLERGEEAIIPEGWLIQPEKGVGKAVRGQTETLFEDD